MRTATFLTDEGTVSPRLRDEVFDHPSHVDMLLAIIGVGPETRLRLLDVGSGTGRMLRQFSDRRPLWRYEGIDWRPDLVAHASRQAPEVRFECADLRTLNLRRDFDVVTCLGHILSLHLSDEDLDAVLATLALHIRPGGLVLLDVVPAAIPVPEREHAVERSFGPVTVHTSMRVNEPGYVSTSRIWRIGNRSQVETFTQRATPQAEITYRLKDYGMRLLGEWDGLLAYQAP